MQQQSGLVSLHSAGEGWCGWKVNNVSGVLSNVRDIDQKLPLDLLPCIEPWAASRPAVHGSWPTLVCPLLPWVRFPLLLIWSPAELLQSDPGPTFLEKSAVLVQFSFSDSIPPFFCSSFSLHVIFCLDSLPYMLLESKLPINRLSFNLSTKWVSYGEKVRWWPLMDAAVAPFQCHSPICPYYPYGICHHRQ